MSLYRYTLDSRGFVVVDRLDGEPMQVSDMKNVIEGKSQEYIPVSSEELRLAEAEARVEELESFIYEFGENLPIQDYNLLIFQLRRDRDAARLKLSNSFESAYQKAREALNIAESGVLKPKPRKDLGGYLEP